MAQTAKHARKGGNAGVYDQMVKRGVSPTKAKQTARKFRQHVKKGS